MTTVDYADMEFDQSDQDWCGVVMAALNKFSPGHPWHVYVSAKQGSVIIKNLALNKHPGYQGLCYFIPYLDMTGDHGMKCVMRAAGTLLEYFNIPRTGGHSAEATPDSVNLDVTADKRVLVNS